MSCFYSKTLNNPPFDPLDTFLRLFKIILKLCLLNLIFEGILWFLSMGVFMGKCRPGLADCEYYA